MEFRYRAIDGDRPPIATDTTSTQSPNPIFSFLSARPNSGCNVEPREDHHLKAIQREIEKEQIRQEIIAAETARRRELIAEVVQEMAIEREMAIRKVAETGMSLEDKLTMCINQRKLLPNQNQDNNNLFRHMYTSYSDPLMYTGPYGLVTLPMTQFPPLQQTPEATPVLESNEDKLIVLNRPDPIGAKRKAEDIQIGLERAKRGSDGVCLVRDPPENKAKEAALSVETGETVSSKLPPCSGKQVESKQKLKFKFWCDICGVGAFSQTVMRNHELGKKHIAAIKKQNEPPETDSTSFIITPPVSATAPQSEAITVLENANVQDHQKVAAKETGEKKKKVTFWCEICNIRTYSEQVMETHRLGKKHKALLEKHQNKTLAGLDTNLIITEPVRSLSDDLGEKGKVHCLDKVIEDK